MFETILSSLGEVFSLSSMLFMFIGVFTGVLFGAIPGLSGGLAIVVVLPLTFAMPSMESILMLIGVYCGGQFGGSISAIMLGTPGTVAATATVIDGQPLAKKGYSNKALSIALYSSFFGGTLSAIALLLFAPFISKYAIRLGPPEYFSIAFLGLAIIAGVSGKSVFSGIISACLGIVLATVGMDILTGAQRFVFGNMNLLKGLPFFPILLGVFVLPDIYKSLHKIVKKTRERELTKDAIENFKQKPDDKLQKGFFKRHISTLSKSSLIGIVIGAMPGAGAAIAAYLGYGEAKRSAKNSGEFGHGAEAGIVAPEAANNAVAAASFIPLLTLGIPGSVVAAMLIGALTLHGVSTGPLMIKNQGTWFYAIIIGFLVVQFIMLIVGKVFIKVFKNILKIPRDVVMPGLIVFCIIGAYAFQGRLFDVGAFIVFGTLFYALKKLGAIGAPFVLGFILGPIIEFNLSGSLVMGHGSISIFFTRPVCVFFLVLSVVLTVLMYIQNKKANKFYENESILENVKEDGLDE